MNNEVTVKKHTLKTLMALQLTIPDYQRRYCWSKQQVALLLEDIESLPKNNGQPPLFLGTVILHKDKGKDNLVDGQQRCVTLALLLKALYEKLGLPNESPTLSLMQAEFPDSQSQQSLWTNYRSIKSYLDTEPKRDFTTMLDTLWEKMEFVVITIDSIDQAFTFFDSQNSSGKRLTQFDLLKARHLRGLISNPGVGIGCSNLWERYENQKVCMGNGQRLAYYLTEQILARTRMRQRNKDVASLQLEHEFSVNTGNNKNTSASATIPLSPPTAVDFYRHWQVAYVPNTANTVPFEFTTELGELNNSSLVYKVVDITQLALQLNQPLVGGEQFFFYIAKYTELYLRYFPDDVKNSTSDDPMKTQPLQQQLLRLHRIVEQGQSAGYSRLIEVWLALVVFYLDRFGEDGSFTKFVCASDHYVFSLRITVNNLRRDSVENHFKDNEVFQTLLEQSTSTQALAFINDLCDKQAVILELKLKNEELSKIVKNKKGVIWRYLERFYKSGADCICDACYRKPHLLTVINGIVNP